MLGESDESFSVIMLSFIYHSYNYNSVYMTRPQGELCYQHILVSMSQIGFVQLLLMNSNISKCNQYSAGQACLNYTIMFVNQ